MAADGKAASDRAFIDVDDLVELHRVLEVVVVSIHRIATQQLDSDGSWDELGRFMSTGGGWRELSRARKIVALNVDRALGEDGAAAIVEGLQFWPDIRDVGQEPWPIGD